MSNLYQTALVAALFGLLTACGDAGDHPHDGDADHGHPHDDAAEHGHPHDDAAEQTEAFYGDEAVEPAESADPAHDAAEDEEHDHHHDGEGHEHQH